MKSTYAKGQWDLEHLIDQVRAVCEITPEGCWLWRYGKWKDRNLADARPYPRLIIGGVRKPVMRWVLEASGKPGSPGLEPCHQCDRPQCVAPHHLTWKTHKENMQEMGQRGRAGAQRDPQPQTEGLRRFYREHPERINRGPRTGNYQTGDDHWTRRTPEKTRQRGVTHVYAQLDPGKVRDIRALSQRGEEATLIAWRFGVGRGTIRAVLEGRTWKHVR